MWVTGVQTCALPIYNQAPVTQIFMAIRRENKTNSIHILFQSMAVRWQYFEETFCMMKAVSFISVINCKQKLSWLGIFKTTIVSKNLKALEFISWTGWKITAAPCRFKTCVLTVGKNNQVPLFRQANRFHKYTKYIKRLQADILLTELTDQIEEILFVSRCSMRTTTPWRQDAKDKLQ